MFKSILKEENGMAMIVVIGIMLVLTTLAFGAMAISENDLKLTERDKDSMEALHVAEAGIQKAMWQLEKFGNVMENKDFTADVGNGKAYVVAEQDDSNEWLWTIESTGTCNNANRKIKVTVFNFSLWNMNMSLGQSSSLASGGNGVLGTTSIDGPFYVRGNVELSGSSQITGGPFFIKTGSLKFLDSGSTLGLAGDELEAYIEPADGNYDIEDKKGNHIIPPHPQVHVSKLSNQVPDIKIPPMDSLANYRKTAADESDEVCTAYNDGVININTVSRIEDRCGYYKILDNDANDSTGSLSSRHTYKLNSTVPSFGVDGSGNAVGDFAWNKDSRKLTVNGTVFVDGNLTIGDSSNSEINYYGRGTIVVNGDINIKGKLRPPYQDGKYDMSGTNVLGLVTNETIYVDVSGSNSVPKWDEPDVSGAFFATKKVKMTSNNTSFVGSMIAGVLDFAGSVNNSHLFTHDKLPEFLPPSLPGSTRYMTMTASWREVN